jgi:hypothetical protein
VRAEKATAEHFGGGLFGGFQAAVVGRIWRETRTGNILGEDDTPALWQALYDEANAQVRAHGGHSRKIRPKRATPQHRP